jgi:hypothetical protein
MFLSKKDSVLGPEDLKAKLGTCRERQTGVDWNSPHLVPASSTHGGVEEGREERSVSERQMKEKRTTSGLLVPVAAEIPSELSPPTVLPDLRHRATDRGPPRHSAGCRCGKKKSI